MQSQWGKSSEAPPPPSPQEETPVAMPGLKRTFEAGRNPGRRGEKAQVCPG
jgi:hypothetical protein